MDLLSKKLNLDYSLNSPYGACEECEGIGVKLNVDPKLVVPDEKKQYLKELLFPGQNLLLYYAQTLASLAKHYKFSLDDKWKNISNKRCYFIWI